MERKLIAYTKKLLATELSSSERDLLVSNLYPLYCDLFEPIGRHNFIHAILFRGANTRLALFYGPDGEIAGFSSLVIETINHENRQVTVIDAGVYIDLHYKGGNVASRFGLFESLRYKIKNPFANLAYIAQASSPAPYSLYARTLRCFYPHKR